MLSSVAFVVAVAEVVKGIELAVSELRPMPNKFSGAVFGANMDRWLYTDAEAFINGSDETNASSDVTGGTCDVIVAVVEETRGAVLIPTDAASVCQLATSYGIDEDVIWRMALLRVLVKPGSVSSTALVEFRASEPNPVAVPNPVERERLLLLLYSRECSGNL